MFFFSHGSFSQGFWKLFGNVGMPGFPCGASFSPPQTFFFGGGVGRIVWQLPIKTYQKMVGLIFAMKFTTSNFFETSGEVSYFCRICPQCRIHGWMVYLPRWFSLFFMGSTWVDTPYIYIYTWILLGSSIEEDFFEHEQLLPEERWFKAT